MNTVTIYSRNACPFCVRAEQLLKRKRVTHFVKINIELNPDQREIMIARTGRRTVPQIYIGETHVGGFDDLAALDRTGRLDLLLKAKPESRSPA